MADIHSASVRSYNMSQIKSKNTKPEILVRRFLHKQGYRYRLHVKNLPGTPDIVLPKYKTVIFIHGCFWHGHENCNYSAIPKTRTEWWKVKIDNNIRNDNKAVRELLNIGCKVITVWTCQLKTKLFNETMTSIMKQLSP